MDKDNELDAKELTDIEKLMQSFMEPLDTAEKDLVPLVVAMDYMMKQYGLPTHYFLSSVFSNTKRSQQFQTIINAFERFKCIEMKREADEKPSRAVEVEVSEVALPPIDEQALNQLYDVRLTDYSIDALVKRILKEGIGDWCVLKEAEDTGERKIALHQPLLYVTDIQTNTEYTLTKQMFMDTINEIWVDFPWAIDFEFNSDLDVMLLTEQDMDEIIQVACLEDIVYPYPW